MNPDTRELYQRIQILTLKKFLLPQLFLTLKKHLLPPLLSLATLVDVLSGAYLHQTLYHVPELKLPLLLLPEIYHLVPYPISLLQLGSY